MSGRSSEGVTRCAAVPPSTPHAQLSHCPTRQPLGIATPAASPRARSGPSFLRQTALRPDRAKVTVYSASSGTVTSRRAGRNFSLNTSKRGTPRAIRAPVRASSMGCGPHM